MPVISMFYGVIVLMYYFDNKKHHLPHIHAQYGEEEAVISIPEGKYDGRLAANRQAQAGPGLGRDSS